MSIFLHVVVGCLALIQVNALIGFDAAPVVSFQSTFDCLKSGGYSFANIRAYSVEGVDLDLSVKDTLIYAQRSGFKTDLFLRPCKGKSAKFQIDAIMLAIAEQYYDRFWLYLGHNPNAGCEWSSPHTNCDYIKTMVDQIKYFKKPVGIYVSPEQWRNIMGSLGSCPELGEYPLIYPNNNNSPNFDDFVPFGGWKAPYGKVFQSNITACGTTINKIYREGSANLI